MDVKNAGLCKSVLACLAQTGSINLLSAIQAGAEQQTRRDKESKVGGPDTMNTEITTLLCGCLLKKV